MKGYKVLLCVVCAVITIVAAVTAIIIFRNEIAEFFEEVKDKIDAKRLSRDESADYADI